MGPASSNYGPVARTTPQSLAPTSLEAVLSGTQVPPGTTVTAVERSVRIRKSSPSEGGNKTSPGKRILEHELAEAQSHMQGQYEAFERALEMQRSELKNEAEEFLQFNNANRTGQFELAAGQHRYEANLAMQLQLERAGTEFKYFRQKLQDAQLLESRCEEFESEYQRSQNRIELGIKQHSAEIKAYSSTKHLLDQAVAAEEGAMDLYKESSSELTAMQFAEKRIQGRYDKTISEYAALKEVKAPDVTMVDLAEKDQLNGEIEANAKLQEANAKLQEAMKDVEEQLAQEKQLNVSSASRKVQDKAEVWKYEQKVEATRSEFQSELASSTQPLHVKIVRLEDELEDERVICEAQTEFAEELQAQADHAQDRYYKVAVELKESRTKVLPVEASIEIEKDRKGREDKHDESHAEAIASSSKETPMVKASVQVDAPPVTSGVTVPMDYRRTDEVKVEPLPDPKGFRKWKMALRKLVAGASTDPDEAFKWFCEVDSAKAPEELNQKGKFTILDAKLAAGLGKVLGGELGRQIEILEEQAALKSQMLSGRATAWHIFQHYKLSETEGAILEFEDLQKVELKGENLRALVNDWDLVLCSLKEVPSKSILESMFRTQLNKAESMKTVLALYDQDITQKGASKDYDRLLSMTRTHVAQKRRDKVANDLRSRGKGTPGTRAQSNNKRTKPQQGDCRQWLKFGECSRGDECSWAHDEDKRPEKPSGKTAGRKSSGKGSKSRSSSPKGGREGRNRSTTPSSKVRGTSPSGKEGRPTCTFYLRGECNRGKNCEYFHPQPCTHFNAGSCKLGEECEFAHFTAEPKEKAKAKTKAKVGAPAVLMTLFAATLAGTGNTLKIDEVPISSPVGNSRTQVLPSGIQFCMPAVPVACMGVQFSIPKEDQLRVTYRDEVPSLGVYQWKTPGYDMDVVNPDKVDLVLSKEHARMARSRAANLHVDVYGEFTPEEQTAFFIRPEPLDEKDAVQPPDRKNGGKEEEKGTQDESLAKTRKCVKGTQDESLAKTRKCVKGILQDESLAKTRKCVKGILKDDTQDESLAKTRKCVKGILKQRTLFKVPSAVGKKNKRLILVDSGASFHIVFLRPYQQRK